MHMYVVQAVHVCPYGQTLKGRVHDGQTLKGRVHDGLTLEGCELHTLEDLNLIS